MFGALPPQEQMKAFEPPPAGQRKVVLATNIAETSITINGIRHVIDPGLVKQRHFDPKRSMELLAVTAISKAQVGSKTGMYVPF